MFKLNRKKLTKKVQKIIKSDIFASVALVSILFNIILFSAVLLYQSTNAIDLSVYNASYDKLCKDRYDDNLIDQIEESSDPAYAKALFEVKCESGDFQRYYDNAVESYLNDIR